MKAPAGPPIWTLSRRTRDQARHDGGDEAHAGRQAEAMANRHASSSANDTDREAGADVGQKWSREAPSSSVRARGRKG